MKAHLIILLIISVIALIPVGVDGGYNSSGLRFFVRVGLVQLRVYPPGRLLSRLTQKTKKPKKKKPPTSAELEEQKPEKPKSKPKMSKDDIFSLLKMGLKAMSRFRRKLTVDYLRIHITVASGDPFKTAMGYGTASAALSAAIPLAEGAFNITERDFGVSCDFLAEKAQPDFWLTASIQIWEILYVGAAFAIDFLKNKRKKKRAAAQADDPSTERTDTNGKTSYRRPDGNDSEQYQGNGGREHHRGRSHNNA